MNATAEPSAARANVPFYRRPLRWYTVVAVLVALTLGLRWSAVLESLCFIHPEQYKCITPHGVEDVYFTTPDGKKLHAWFLPAFRPNASGPAPAVLYCHGNQGAVDTHIAWGEFLQRQGISVFLFDYRSFGTSEYVGRLVTRNDFVIDTRGAWDAMLARPDVDKNRVGVYGVSLGGAFAYQLAAERPDVKAVCSICTFSTWAGVAGDVLPVLSQILIMRGVDQVDNIVKLGTRPVLIVHGDQDQIVPPRHGKILLDAAKAAGVNARLRMVNGAGHLDVVLQQDAVQGEIARFFNEAFEKGK